MVSFFAFSPMLFFSRVTLLTLRVGYSPRYPLSIAYTRINSEMPWDLIHVSLHQVKPIGQIISCQQVKSKDGHVLPCFFVRTPDGQQVDLRKIIGNESKASFFFSPHCIKNQMYFGIKILFSRLIDLVLDKDATPRGLVHPPRPVMTLVSIHQYHLFTPQSSDRLDEEEFILIHVLSKLADCRQLFDCRLMPHSPHLLALTESAATATAVAPATLYTELPSALVPSIFTPKKRRAQSDAGSFEMPASVVASSVPSPSSSDMSRSVSSDSLPHSGFRRLALASPAATRPASSPLYASSITSMSTPKFKLESNDSTTLPPLPFGDDDGFHWHFPTSTSAQLSQSFIHNVANAHTPAARNAFSDSTVLSDNTVMFKHDAPFSYLFPSDSPATMMSVAPTPVPMSMGHSVSLSPEPCIFANDQDGITLFPNVPVDGGFVDVPVRRADLSNEQFDATGLLSPLQLPVDF